MEQQQIITEAISKIQKKLNRNGYNNGVVRIEVYSYRIDGIKETKRPIPMVSKNGSLLISVKNY